jgi:hypothetical protein
VRYRRSSMSARIRGYVRQHHVGLVALFFALSGGVAWATHPGGQNTISTADIINGQVKTADLGDGEVKVADVGEGAVKTAELANGEVRSADIGQAAVDAEELAANSVAAGEIADGQVKAAEIATGAVRTDELQNGQVQAEDLAPGVAPGASGARAWGLVDPSGNLLRSKNVTEVFDAAFGIYCVDPGPGINASTAVMVVGDDLASGATNDRTGQVSHPGWDSTPDFCPPGTMEVRTFLADGDPATGGELDFGGYNLAPIAQQFTFVIP